MRVVIGREVDRLGVTRPGTSAETAVSAGTLVRRKVEGIWLYARDEQAIDQATVDVLQDALKLCGDWLLGSMRILTGKIAKDSGLVTMEAVRPIVRAHLRAGSLGGLPALTREYEPHLSIYDPSDESEIQSILVEAIADLAAKGAIDAAGFREPENPRGSRAWRYAFVAHLEWLGLGSAAEGRLKSWESL